MRSPTHCATASSDTTASRRQDQLPPRVQDVGGSAAFCRWSMQERVAPGSLLRRAVDHVPGDRHDDRHERM
jgi:hypothetical protein